MRIDFRAMFELSVLSVLALAGCDQFATVGVQPAQLVDGGSAPAPIDSGTPPLRDAMSSEPDDAMTLEPDASMSSDGGADAAIECAAVPTTLCNPIKNEGCDPALGQQCAIDQLNVRTGYCIFKSETPAQLGGACFNSGVTESCEPQSTCSADGVCRRICSCDADCGAAGQCCNQPVGATGFNVCGDC